MRKSGLLRGLRPSRFANYPRTLRRRFPLPRGRCRRHRRASCPACLRPIPGAAGCFSLRPDQIPAREHPGLPRHRSQCHRPGGHRPNQGGRPKYRIVESTRSRVIRTLPPADRARDCLGRTRQDHPAAPTSICSSRHAQPKLLRDPVDPTLEHRMGTRFRRLRPGRTVPNPNSQPPGPVPPILSSWRSNPRPMPTVTVARTSHRNRRFSSAAGRQVR